MRKKSLIAGMVMVMSAMMLNACGGPSKADYKADIETLNTFSEDVVSAADAEEYADAATKMEMKTEEGKVLKEDMEELGDYLSELTEMMEDLDNVDVDAASELEEKVEKLQKEAEEHVDAFTDAAKDAGIKDEDLEDLGF